MVQYYTVLGRKVGSHYLAMGVLTALFGGSYAALGGGNKVKPGATPPINASSSDEEDFIKKFLDENSGKKKEEAKH